MCKLVLVKCVVPSGSQGSLHLPRSGRGRLHSLCGSSLQITLRTLMLTVLEEQQVHCVAFVLRREEDPVCDGDTVCNLRLCLSKSAVFVKGPNDLLGSVRALAVLVSYCCHLGRASALSIMLPVTCITCHLCGRSSQHLMFLKDCTSLCVLMYTLSLLLSHFLTLSFCFSHFLSLKLLC